MVIWKVETNKIKKYDNDDRIFLTEAEEKLL